jgi:hypothetical protein
MVLWLMNKEPEFGPKRSGDYAVPYSPRWSGKVLC